MSVVTKLRPHTYPARSSRRYVAGALTVAVAAGVSAATMGGSDATHSGATHTDQADAQAPSVEVKTDTTSVAVHPAAFPEYKTPSATRAPLLIGSMIQQSFPSPKAAANTAVHEAASQTLQKYGNNLDGWIHESLDVLARNHIPASYEGIMRNIMRESTGNPRAINLSDSNAAAGTPSKGLLQIIDPTFAAYHVAGTPFDIWNPVSNIVAACNYAAHNYGSINNVDSAY